jgi:hypothetical protein
MKETTMIRTSLVALSVCLLTISFAVAQEKKEAPPAQEKSVTPAARVSNTAAPWFDFKNCAMCKCMADEGLMDHVKCETHVIDNGMLMFASIPADKKAAFEKCEKEMKAVAEKLKSGEKVALCGFCQSYGELMKAGAKEQDVVTAAGHIHLLTSDKPDVVKKIHEHAKTTIAEYKTLSETLKKTSTK